MWRKNFRTRKFQTILIFLVIMLSSALLTGSASILIGLDKPLYELAKQSNSATAIFYSDMEVLELEEHRIKFQELAEVKQAEMVKYHPVTEEVHGNGKKIEAFLKLTEYKESVFSDIVYLEGDRTATINLKDDECIIPACISSSYQLHIGDSITLHNSINSSYKIVGVYTNLYSISNAFDSDILINQLKEDSFTTKNMLYLYGKEGVTGKNIETAYRNHNNGILYGTLITLEMRISSNLLAGNVIGGVLLAIGAIMLIVSILIIQFMIRHAMLMDINKIAVYKVIGYSSFDILLIYLMFYFVIVTVACMLGIACSVLLSNQVLHIIYENVGNTRRNSVLLPGVVCYSMVISLALLITFHIVRKYERKKPAVTLSGHSIQGIKKQKSYKGNSSLPFSPTGIALRTIIRDKKSVVGILITCMVTIFAINFAVISLDVANSMKENNDYWLGIDKSNVVINISGNEDATEIYEILDRDTRVNHYLRSSYGNDINLKWDENTKLTSLDGFLYESFDVADLPVIQGRNPSNANEIAISTKVAAENNKTIGDYMEVYLGGKTRVWLLITGIYQTYYQLGEICRLKTDAYLQAGQPFRFNNISIYLKDSKTQNEFIHDITKQIGTKGIVIPRTKQFENIMELIIEPQKKILPPMIVLVILLGCMNLFCIVLLKNASQFKINGIYKSIGYSTTHLLFTNLNYIGVLGVVSMIISVPSVIISYPYIMTKCLSMFGFLEYPVSYQWHHIFMTNLGIVLVFLCSTLLSSKSLYKVNVRALIQE